MTIDCYDECQLFVEELHKHQLDKGGNPYYHHLYEVANNAKDICQKLKIDDESFIKECCIIALLHDSVEDCELSFEVIEQKYGKEVANGVRLMTKQEDYTNTLNQQITTNALFKVHYILYLSHLYQSYLSQKSYAKKAMIVKLSDLKSNLNYHRLGVTSIDELSKSQLNNLSKYHTAYQLLASIIFDNCIVSLDDFQKRLLSAKPCDDLQSFKQSIHQIIDQK